jgi:D-alanine-D-alanine ligase
MATMSTRGRLLVLWNQVEEDVYERWRAEGPRPLDWSPDQTAPDVGTVQEEMDALVKALRDGGFDVRVVNLEDDFDRLVSAIRFHGPDAIFNLVEYFNDDATQEALVAGVYDLLGVPYTGSRPVTLATCQNKWRTKVLLEAAGLPTACYFIAPPGRAVVEDHGLEYPLIVKPALEDASGGIEQDSVVHDYQSLLDRVKVVWDDYEQSALVEEYIEGREIHAALIGNDPPEVLPLFEMEFDDSEFNPEAEWRPRIISFRAKWDPHSTEFYSMDAVVPPRGLDEALEQRIRQVALGAFRALGCRDYARIDMRVDDRGEVFILEVNPNPDLVDGTAYIQCAVASGRTFGETLCEIADLAVKRGQQGTLEPEAGSDLPSDTLLREFLLGRREGRVGAAPGIPAGATPASGGAAGQRSGSQQGDAGSAPAPQAAGVDGAEAGPAEVEEPDRSAPAEPASAGAAAEARAGDAAAAGEAPAAAGAGEAPAAAAGPGEAPAAAAPEEPAQGPGGTASAPGARIPRRARAGARKGEVRASRRRKRNTPAPEGSGRRTRGD